MNYLLKICFFVFLYLLSVTSKAEQAYIKSLKETTTLPKGKIFSVKQGKNGFIWLATESGLYRFDGYEYEEHAFLNSDGGIRLNRVKDIHFDQYGKIWILGNRNSLYYYETNTQTLKEVNFNNFTSISSIAVCDTLLLLNINNDVYSINIDQKIEQELTPKILDVDLATKNIRKCIIENKWYRIDNQEKHIIDSLKKKHSFLKKFTHIFTDPHQNKWLRHHNQLYKYDAKNKKITKIKGIKTLINSIEYDTARQRVWILTESELYYLHHQDSIAHKLSFYNNSLQDESFNKLYIDQQANLWAKTEDNLYHISFPINVFNDNSLAPQIKNEVVTAIHQDLKGNLWYHMIRKGVVLVTPDSIYTNMFYLKFLRFFASMPDSSVVIAKGQKLIKLTYDDNFKIEGFNNPITSNKNELWLSEFKSIYKKEIGKEANENLNTNMILNHIQYDTYSQSILLSTSFKGMLRLVLDQKDTIVKVQHINKAKGLQSNLVITSLSQGKTLWLATSVGLSKLVFDDTENKYTFIKNYTTKDGLSNNNVISIVAQNDTTLWLGTRQGLNKFDIVSEQFTTYHKEAGYLSDNFINRAAIKTKDGQLQFGTRGGLLSFNPESIKQSKYQYAANVQLHSINGKQGYTINDLDHLSHRQNTLKFKISIPNFISPKSIRYRYRLSNTAPWIYQFALENEVTLYNLPFGQYEFDLQTSNEDNIWSDQHTNFPIHIHPPFWLRWWFILASILLIATAISLYIRISIKQLTKKKEFDMKKKEFNMKLSLEKKLRETDLEKIKFFTNVSHDLKTPLTMISEPIEKINSETVSEEEKRFLLQKVSKNTNRLIQLVNKALDFSTIEHQGLTLNVQSVDMTSFLEEIVHDFALKAKEKEVSLSFETTEAAINIAIDKEKMERVFFNLLSNALKYTSPKDSIRLSLSKTELSSEALIILEDTGKGIKQEKLKHLFTRFYQTDPTKQGQGIGLSIVKEYIDAHDGEIEIESKVGKGTKISIYLPLEKNTNIQEHNLEEESVEIPVTNTKASKKVLIVEDDKELRDYIRYELSADFQLFYAKDGQEGIALAETKLPDIIITDFMMPKISGAELCVSLKSNPKTAHIPIILITAIGHSETALLRSGANDFIAKPFKIKNLKLKIKNLLITLDNTKNWLERELNLIPQPAEYQESEETRFIKRLMVVIEKHLISEKLNVSFLAREVGMSKAVLHRKCSQLTGYTVNELITSVRLKKAAELVLHSEHTFSEITNMLGYSSLRHFRNLFKNKYHMTMKEYKLQHKQA